MKLFSLVVLALSCTFTFAQEHITHFCGQVAAQERLFARHPHARAEALRATEALENECQAAQSQRGGGSELYIIPVVFHIIHENGPENISCTIQRWALECGIRFEYIQPGKPQQNAYVERFNRTVRYEWLSQYYWSSIEEVQDFATQWMWSYNHDRPHMALGGFTPKQHLAKAA